MGIHRILVGLDGSQDSRRAAAWAADLGGSVDAEVIAAHVLGLLHRAADGSLLPSDMHRDAIRAELETWWSAPLRDAGVRYQTELREGTPVPTLLAIGDEIDADLFVVGSRGTGGFPGLLLGSTSSQLSQHAHRPVVIVPCPAS